VLAYRRFQVQSVSF